MHMATMSWFLHHRIISSVYCVLYAITRAYEELAAFIFLRLTLCMQSCPHRGHKQPLTGTRAKSLSESSRASLPHPYHKRSPLFRPLLAQRALPSLSLIRHLAVLHGVSSRTLTQTTFNCARPRLRAFVQARHRQRAHKHL